MSVTSAIVLFAVIWFLTFLIVIPFRIKTQGDLGTIVKGTQAGAPEVHNLRRKAIITTGASLVLWLVITLIILSEIITIQDIDFFGKMVLESN
jgi:predicted secreted protein|tara:strand:+ start:516 stop:794 length:279 start_codon:yes stop_codon:yes gene_type:complete